MGVLAIEHLAFVIKLNVESVPSNAEFYLGEAPMSCRRNVLSRHVSHTISVIVNPHLRCNAYRNTLALSCSATPVFVQEMSAVWRVSGLQAETAVSVTPRFVST